MCKRTFFMCERHILYEKQDEIHIEIAWVSTISCFKYYVKANKTGFKSFKCLIL